MSQRTKRKMSSCSMKMNSQHFLVADIEESNGRTKKIRINFDSPRTFEAANLLGIKLEDCIEKPKEEFYNPDVEERIAELRYNYHKKGVQDKIRSLVKLREELAKVSRKKKVNVNSESVSKKLEKTSSALPEIWKEREKLSPQDKKKLADLLKRTWSTAHLTDAAASKNGSLSPAPPLKSSQISSPKREQKTTDIAKLHKKAQEALKKINSSKLLGPKYAIERLLSSERECCGKLTKSNFAPEKSTSSMSDHKSSGGMSKYGPNSNRDKEHFWKKRAEQADENYEKSQRILRNIEDKMKSAADKAEQSLFTKALMANNTNGRNVNEIKESSYKQADEIAAKRRFNYMRKAMKIMDSKKRKQQVLSENIKSNHEKYETKKEKQKELYLQKKEEEQLAIEELRRFTYAKSTRVKQSTKGSLEGDERREIFDEMQKLHFDLQKEKIQRIKQTDIVRRKQLLDMQLFIQEQRNRTTEEFKKREHMKPKNQNIIDAVSKMLENRSAKESSEQFIKLINQKLDLGLQLPK